MALEVNRKAKENIQSLIRRFSQKFRQSGILIEARNARFKNKEKSKEAKKKEALRREELKKHYEELKKLG